jgi:hypothetical protein
MDPHVSLYYPLLLHPFSSLIAGKNTASCQRRQQMGACREEQPLRPPAAPPSVAAQEMVGNRTRRQAAWSQQGVGSRPRGAPSQERWARRRPQAMRPRGEGLPGGLARARRRSPRPGPAACQDA